MLRVVAYGDQHQIITAFAQRLGIIPVMVHYAMKSRRFGGALGLFTAGDWTISRRRSEGFYRLVEVSVREPFLELRRNYHRLTYASLLNELVLRLAPSEQPCPELFSLYTHGLHQLNQAELGLEAVPGFFNILLLHLLRWQGSQPVVGACYYCQKKLSVIPPEEILSGLPHSAGWACARCAPSSSFSFPASSLIRAIFGVGRRLSEAVDPTSVDGPSDKNLCKFLLEFCQVHLPGLQDHPLKASRFL